MLDGILKPRLAPLMGKSADRVRQSGLTSTKLVLIAFAIGLTGCLVGSLQVFPLALIFILLNRFIAAIASVMDHDAESHSLTKYLAPLCDYIFFGAFAFFFTLAAPEHSMAAAFLILSYLAMAISQLSQKLLATNGDTNDTPRGGIIETAEVTLFMTICCLYPPGFSAFAALFGLLCWATAVWRIAATVKILRS